MNNTNPNPQQEKRPLQVAEELYAECMIISVEAPNEEEKQTKMRRTMAAATAYLDYQVDYWLQVRAEWQNLKNMGKHENDWFHACICLLLYWDWLIRCFVQWLS